MEPPTDRGGYTSSGGQELAPQTQTKRSTSAQGPGAGGMGRNAEPARRFGALSAFFTRLVEEELLRESRRGR